MKDLNKMKELGELKWFFKKSDGVNASNLKEQVLNALKKQDGSPVDELKNLFNDPLSGFANKMSNLFDTDIANAADLLDELSDPNNFKKVFEIVE